MDLVIGNMAGLWVLTAIPLLIAIHFFQQKSRPLKISTLFLLSRLAPESAQGRSFERLRSSWPLFLQLLCILIATWILMEPRWLKDAPVHKAVIVLDSSLSMKAFRPELRSSMESFLKNFSSATADLELHILSTDLSVPAVYRGADMHAALRALDEWEPTRGTHDFTPAFRLAQTLAADKTILVFFTDRPGEVPGAMEQIAVGRPIDNVGFLGAQIISREGKSLWKAIVKNHSSGSVQRNWWLEKGGTKSPAQKLSLGAGQFVLLSGEFPAGVDSLELKLDADDFPVDDSLPVVRPTPKEIRIYFDRSSGLTPFFERFVRSLPGARLSPDINEADLKIIAVKNPSLPLPEGNVIAFLDEFSESPPFFKGALVQEDHPLGEDLNFQGLLVQGTPLSLPVKASDDVIFWAGTRPLLINRDERGAKVLFVNFDPELSNAMRLPSFILLLNRFIEDVRSQMSGFQRINRDLGQLVSLAIKPGSAALEVQGQGVILNPPTLPDPVQTNGAALLTAFRAPGEPGFLTITQGQETLLEMAAQFADARQADFKEAAKVNTALERLPELKKSNSREDFLTPLWVILLMILLLLTWRLTTRVPVKKQSNIFTTGAS